MAQLLCFWAVWQEKKVLAEIIARSLLHQSLEYCLVQKDYKEGESQGDESDGGHYNKMPF